MHILQSIWEKHWDIAISGIGILWVIADGWLQYRDKDGVIREYHTESARHDLSFCLSLLTVMVWAIKRPIYRGGDVDLLFTSLAYSVTMLLYAFILRRLGNFVATIKYNYLIDNNARPW